MENRIYIAIDLKSFYASVECIARGLDPLDTNLVVADESRTEKTICLAVSPSLRAYGIPGRARLFEVIGKVREINKDRRRMASGGRFTGSSFLDSELRQSRDLELSFITATPRMALYKQISVNIYQIYLKYIAPEDIHVYSIDEVFIDATSYLSTYKMTARELAMTMITDVLKNTGITATAGIGTNMYLCKVALDIQAKHIEPDKNGVRIAELDEMSYRRLLWSHRPLTDFWRVGHGYSGRLEKVGLYTMGDIARCSVGRPHEYYNEDLLYKLFGVNAELLIDHAWGWEPCTISCIKAYKPLSSSTCSGQVLEHPYTFDKALLVVKEMTEQIVLDLVDKGLVTDQIVMDVGYDVESLKDPDIRRSYRGEIVTDRYGRRVPKGAHGTGNIGRQTSSTKLIMNTVTELFRRITDKNLLIKRLTVTACRLTDEHDVIEPETSEQMDLFTDYEALDRKRAEEETALDREKRIQHTVIGIRKRYGKNAIIKGLDLEDGATAMKRNRQIGGHRA